MKKITTPHSKLHLFREMFFKSKFAWVVFVCGLFLTFGTYQLSHSAIQLKSHEKFNLGTNEIIAAIDERMTVYEQVLWSGVGLLKTNDAITRRQWHDYVEGIELTKHWPGIQGLGYAIPISAADKQTHIAAIQGEGFKDYTIHPEGIREEYSAIIFLEPFDWRNKRAFGYDMWSNPVRREAMRRARDTGKVSTSGIITLVQETDSDIQQGFLTYLPYYEPEASLETIEQRRKAFRGWVFSPFRAKDLMSGVLGAKERIIDFEIYDGEVPSSDSLLFKSTNTTSNLAHDGQPEFSERTSLEVQGRIWTILFKSKPNFINKADNLQPTVVAIAGFVVTLLLFYVISLFAYLNQRAEQLAAEMTYDLVDTKKKLENSIIDYERSNHELEQFAYVASHDLRSPLRAIENLCSWITEDEVDNLTPESQLHFEKIKKRARYMAKLLDELLLYSRIDKDTETEETLPTNRLLTEILDNLAVPENFNVKIQQHLPDIKGEIVLVRQVFHNLLENAIMHHGGEKGRIDIIGHSEGEMIMFSVKDDGRGIARQHHQKVFDMFEVLSSNNDEKNTGMGLAIVKKAVSQLGGRIELESDVNAGTTIRLYLPRKN